MKDHSKTNDRNTYSLLGCILLLLGTGIVVKIGAAIQLCQLDGGCHLPLGW